MGGDGGGGGDDGFAARQVAEEARKAGLRAKINQLYGIGDAGATSVDRSKFVIPAKAGEMVLDPQNGEGGGYREHGGAPEGFDQPGYDAALAAARNSGNQVAAQMTGEEKRLADATRSFYAEDLKDNYDKAKRRNTFALADRGLLGGSAQVDTETDLKRGNTMGATRIQDEVAAAVNNLKNQREAERLNAVQLVNAGAGEDAVAGAQAGLSRAFENAAAQRKTSIAGDLFAGGADAVAGANSASLGPLAYQQYMQSLRRFSNPVSNVGGRTTPTG